MASAAGDFKKKLVKGDDQITLIAALMGSQK